MENIAHMGRKSFEIFINNTQIQISLKESPYTPLFTKIFHSDALYIEYISDILGE